MSFASLSLNPLLIQALPAQIKQPTKIQSLAIKQLMANENLLAQANTGSGKTFAYGLPMLNNALKPSNDSQGLVLVPTRELAIQVQQALAAIAESLSLSVVCLCGGVDKSEQIEALAKRPNILVATTGRLLDLVNSGEFNLKQISSLVLDEADRMLDMGFWNDVVSIAEKINPSSQIAMFSATFSDALKQKAQQLMPVAKQVSAHQENSTNQDISEQLYLVNKGSKTKALIHLFEKQQWQQVLVFIGAKDNADALTKKLTKAGIAAAALHGNKSQAEREQVLNDFKHGSIKMLIATDLLARGVHVEQLPAVINFELPDHAEVYVHRVGRTARAGHKGLAISLVCHGETQALNAIRQLTQRELPTTELAEFPVTDTPASSTSKRAPRDKQANRRTANKRSIKQFQSKSRPTRGGK